MQDDSIVQYVRTLRGNHGHVSRVRFLRDATHCVSGSSDRDLRVWDLETGRCIRKLSMHKSGVKTLSASADGVWLASGGATTKYIDLGTLVDSTLRLTNLQVPWWGRIFARWQRLITELPEPAHDLDLNRDGTKLIAAVGDEIALLSLDSKQIKLLRGSKAKVMVVRFLPSGQYALSGDSDGRIQMWNLSNGSVERLFEGHESYVASITTSCQPDLNRFVSASGDNSIRIWRLDSGEEIAKLLGHSSAVSEVAVDWNCTSVFSGGIDSTIRLWDVSSAQCVWRVGGPRFAPRFDSPLPREEDGHSKLVLSVDMTPDGKWALSGAEDYKIMLWRIYRTA